MEKSIGGNTSASQADAFHEAKEKERMAASGEDLKHTESGFAESGWDEDLGGELDGLNELRLSQRVDGAEHEGMIDSILLEALEEERRRVGSPEHVDEVVVTPENGGSRIDVTQLESPCSPSTEVFLISQTRLFTTGPIGLLLSAIYSGKSLFLLGIKEPSRKKPHL